MLNVIENASAYAREFQIAMGQPDDAVLSFKLVREEATEVVVAALELMQDETITNVESFLKEVADFAYVMAGAYNQTEGTTMKDVGATHDQLEVLLMASGLVDSARESFLTDEVIAEAFMRVHASNMTKIGDDGRPLRDQDGKVLKGPNYEPPFLTDLAIVTLAKLNAHLEEAEEDEAAAA